MAKKMSMAKYCTTNNINYTRLRNSLKITLDELKRIYTEDFSLFQEIVYQNIKTPGLLRISQIARIFKVSEKRVQVWLLRGMESFVYDKRTHLKYSVVCEFIASGRA